VKIPELFILIPTLLGLKGNLGMNLAARVSTSANLGYLDRRKIRQSLLLGNLSLLQLQSLSVGLLAGILAFIICALTRSTVDPLQDFFFLILSSSICAALSSFVEGSFVCALCVLCRINHVNPDNVATPVASTLGDLLTLTLLAVWSTVMFPWRDFWLPRLMLFPTLLAIPAWITIVLRNEHVRTAAKSGWAPLILAMLFAGTAGLILERNIDRFPSMAILMPVLTGTAGNLATVFCSRLSTAYHTHRFEPYLRVALTLFTLNIPIQLAFLAFLKVANLGHHALSFSFILMYLAASQMTVAILLITTWFLTQILWRYDCDPDDYAIPCLTALGDVVGTFLLVCIFFAV